jgi:hypothetical protein
MLFRDAVSSEEDLYLVIQREPTGGPWTTYGPGQLVTRPAELFINLLPVTTSSFILFTSKDLKEKLRFLSRLLLYIQVSHMLLTLKPYRKL